MRLISDVKEPAQQEMLIAALKACHDHDFKKAVPSLLLLADRLIPEACMSLGYIYQNGNEDVPLDEKLSLFWYSKYFFLLNMLCDQGNLDAGFQLALSYQFGDNIRCDEAKAIELFTHCAENGHAKSQYHLSTLWKHGWCGLEIDMTIRSYWLEKAVAAEYPEALYAKGLDCVAEASPEANEAGFVLLEHSADLGFWPASEFLKRKRRNPQ